MDEQYDYDSNISKQDLIDLLSVATKGQLFQFNGSLYEQVDGVAMGSPLGPLLANVFMSSIEEKLDVEGKLPPYYRRYVDDTFTVMPDLSTAKDSLNTLNHAHPAIKFTVEVEKDGMLPFLGTQLLNRAPRIETKVFVKPTNSSITTVTSIIGTSAAYCQLCSIAHIACLRHVLTLIVSLMRCYSLNNYDRA